MQFTIPQFIEKEAKILGPLTFKQFAFFGVAVLISVVMYFILPFFLFLVICMGLMGGSFALIFYKKEGVPLYNIVWGSIMFKFKPKIYLWKKKGVPPKFFRKEKAKREIEEQKKADEEEKRTGPRLKISKSSHINDLFTQIETKK